MKKTKNEAISILNEIAKKCCISINVNDCDLTVEEDKKGDTTLYIGKIK